MTRLQLRSGKFLRVGNKFSSNDDCCCEGVCPCELGTEGPLGTEIQALTTWPASTVSSSSLSSPTLPVSTVRFSWTVSTNIVKTLTLAPVQFFSNPLIYWNFTNAGTFTNGLAQVAGSLTNHVVCARHYASATVNYVMRCAQGAEDPSKCWIKAVVGFRCTSGVGVCREGNVRASITPSIYTDYTYTYNHATFLSQFVTPSDISALLSVAVLESDWFPASTTADFAGTRALTGSLRNATSGLVTPWTSPYGTGTFPALAPTFAPPAGFGFATGCPETKVDTGGSNWGNAYAPWPTSHGMFITGYAPAFVQWPEPVFNAPDCLGQLVL